MPTGRGALRGRPLPVAQLPAGGPLHNLAAAVHAHCPAAVHAHCPAAVHAHCPAAVHAHCPAACTTPPCWDSILASVAQQVPLVVGEMGEHDCAHGYIDSLIPRLDRPAGAREPASWMVTAVDRSPLASNLAGTGGS
jgi:hypothetical protein